MADDYSIIQLGKSGFKSVPLFLPNTVQYDRETNTISGDTNEVDDDGCTREELVLVPGAGLDILQSINKPVSFVACIGPYRTGKSFLLSRFLNDSKAFELGSTLEGCTRGIWISTSAIVCKDNGEEFYTFLLDCEGAGDPLEGDDASNARIALACILLASVFIFNNVGRPDRSSLQFLSYLETIRKRIPSENLSSSSQFFPSFLWVFRDFFLQLPVNKLTGKTYTLKEYMLDRVLIKPQSKRLREGSDELVMDCILSDFLSFDVASISNPQKQDGNDPFTPGELSRLNDFDWAQFHDDFKADIKHVISLCLSKATPFRLDHSSKNNGFSRGAEFALWCQQVEKLVNSEEVLPNIPDIQQQLLHSIAEKATKEAIETYRKNMSELLDSCPTFNSENNELIKTLLHNENLKGVANDDQMMTSNKQSVAEGTALLAKQITSHSMLEEYTKHFENEVSILYSQLVEENRKRSKLSCEKYARVLYGELKSRLKADPTSISVEEFEKETGTIKKTFKSFARGPCVDDIVVTYLKEQEEADKSFLEQVHSLNLKYINSLKEQELLQVTILEKNIEMGKLEEKFEETKEEHKAELERREQETNEAMETMKNDHARVLDEALQEEKERQKLELATIQSEMEDKLSEAERKRETQVAQMKSDLDIFKINAQNRLDEEVALREDRLKTEEASHKEEVERLLSIADEKMKEEILAGEKKRKAEKESFEKKMDELVQVQQNKLNEEIKKREEELKQKEAKYREEIVREKEDMKKKMEEERLRMERAHKKEKSEYQSRIEELEDKCPCGIM